jgi:hypothetical protein
LGTALVAATAVKYAWDRGVEQVELQMRNADEADEILAQGVES